CGRVGFDVRDADVAIDALGRLHVVDKVGRCVHVFTPDGAWVSAYGDGLTVPRRVAIGAGVVWVADAVAGEVAMFSTDGGEIERRGQDELGGVPVDVHVAARGALAVHVLP
ncbi:MAG TPA: hypothetical protein PKA64_22180, partial [Myxococcota bacterium]|nr:hypothetical protein [Myxococcota bacterium]